MKAKLYRWRALLYLLLAIVLLSSVAYGAGNPTVTVSAPTPTIDYWQDIYFTATFSASVTGLTSAGITVNKTGTADCLVDVTPTSGYNTVYTIKLWYVSGDGTLGIKVNANAAQTSGGKWNLASANSATCTIGNTPPTLTIGAPSTNFTTSGPVTYAVTFSETVTGFASDDIILNKTGSATGSVGVSGSGTSYTVTVSSISGDGTLGITVRDGAVFDQAGNVNWVCVGQPFNVDGCVSNETVWVEDAVPTGATTHADNGDAWTWVTSGPSPYSGTQSNKSSLVTGDHRHYFDGATTTLSVATGDVIFCAIYLDPTNKPSEVMLEWRESGSWEHRAYWGANSINAGTDGTVSRRYMGALPTTGGWVVLKVPASQVGLEGKTLDGMSFRLYNGVASWDRAGKCAGYTITASAGSEGSISPSGSVAVLKGEKVLFTFPAQPGYLVSDVVVDSVSQGALNSYTFSNVSANHTISVSFTGGYISKTDQLLFSALTDCFPSSGLTGSWPTYYPEGQTLGAVGSPTVDIVGGQKMDGNVYSHYEGYLLGRYSSPIAVNGATIVVATRPSRNGVPGSPWNSIVDIFYDRVVLGVLNLTGQVCVKRNINTNNTVDYSTPTIPDGQMTVLSLVVQPDGSYKVWANGVQVMSVAGTGANVTSLNPDHTDTMGSDVDYTHYINVGRNNPDWWSTYNGDIGDVFVYKVALSDVERQQLESEVAKKFGVGSSYTITASAGAGGSINPSGSVTVYSGSSKTFNITPDPGYVVSGVTVDSVSQGAISSYTFSNVTATHTISATFAAGVGPSINTPVAFYKFENDVTDAQGVYNGTAYNSPTYVTGKVGSKAIQFNGTNQYVSITRPISDSFSIAFWVKTTQTALTGTNWYNGSGLVDGYVAASNDDFGISYLSSKLAFGVGNADTTFMSTSNINSGSWVHVACTRDSYTGEMKIYINGALQTTGTGPTGTKGGSTTLHFGDLQTNANYFSGAIDQLRIYNCVLSAADVATLAGEPSTAGLAVYYKFDETSGTTASDSSGNGKNATLVNGPTWVAGQFGNAVNLDGTNDYLTVPTGVVSALNDFSISTWINMTSSGAKNRVFDFGTGTTTYMYLTPNSSGSVVRYAISTSGSGGEQAITGSAPVPTGGWHHVAVTLSGTTGKLYVDGAQVGTNAGMSLKPSSLGSTNLNYLGKSQSADPYFCGKMDDFNIYGYALSASEVQALYGGPTATISAPSIGATKTSPVIFMVTWNKPVTDFTTGDITLNVTGTATATVSLAGSGAYYTISLTGVSGQGTVSITIKDHAVIDASGRQNTQSYTSATVIVGTCKLIDVDATGLSDGAISSWTNTGYLAGAFKTLTASGCTDPTVGTVAGVKCISFSHNNAMDLIKNNLDVRATDAICGRGSYSSATYTVQFWAWRPSLGPGLINYWISDANGRSGVFDWYHRDYDPQFQYGNTPWGHVVQNNGFGPAMTLAPTPGQWHMFTITADGTTTTTYIDGALANATAGTSTIGALEDGQRPFIIGGLSSTVDLNGHPTPWNMFSGSIRKLQVWDDARSASTVLADYNTDKVTTISGTVRDTGSNPVANARVAISTSANAFTNQFFIATTDGSGNYTISAGPGTYYLAAGKGGYTNTADTTATVVSSNITGKDFTLSAAGSPTKLVDISAAALSLGALAQWTNSGTLAGKFMPTGSPTVSDVQGKRAVYFDGATNLMLKDNSNVTIPSPWQITGYTPQFTVSAWVCNPAIADTERYLSWGQYNIVSNGFMTFGYGSSLYSGAVGREFDGPNYNIYFSKLPAANIWHMITYTWDGTTQKLYVDGALDSSTNTAGMAIIESQPVVLGSGYDNADGSSPRDYLSGYIASLQIYDVALTASQILGQGTTISGTVRDQSSNPMPGATIAVATSPNAFTNASYWVAYTDPNGSYSIIVPNGSYYAAARKSGYPTSADRQVTVSGSNVTGVDFTLTYAGHAKLINLDASGLSTGSLSTWSNTGSLGGQFVSVSNPTVADYGGRRGANFAGGAWMKSSPSFTAPWQISGYYPQYSVATWVREATLASEEAYICWAPRFPLNVGQTAQFNYGTNGNWGAATHWGADAGFTTVPAADQWHMFVVTYDGTYENIYVDGALDKSVNRAGVLHFPESEPFSLGTSYDAVVSGDPSSLEIPYNGYISWLGVYDTPLTLAEVQTLYAAPAASIGSPSLSITNTGPVTYSVTFNDNVTGFTSSDITLNTTGSATGTVGVSGSGSSYTVTISSISGNGTLGITVNAGAVLDGDGTPNAASSPSTTFTVDNTPPTVSIGAPSATLTKSGPVTYTVTFSESVTGFASNDVQLNTTGTATGTVGVSGSGTTYTVTLSSCSGDGTIGITVKAGGAIDAAGNGNTVSSASTTFTVDNTAPTASVGAPSVSVTKSGPVTYTVTFSESVTGFSTAGITLNKTGTANGTVGLSGSGTTYTVTISSITGDGTLGITVKASSASDAAGNQNTASSASTTFTVDNTAPTVSVGAPSVSVTKSGPVTYTVTFSESVTGFSTSGIQLNTTGTATGTVGLSGSGTTYTVTISSITGDGTLGITVKANSASDAAGNQNTASSASTTFTVDNTAPTASVGAPSVSITRSGPVTYTVTFSESVTGFSSSGITLNKTGTANGTVGVSGSGTTYTVTISSITGDGTLGITVKANSASDAAGNQNTASSASTTFTVDNTAPTVSIGAPSASLTKSGPVTYTVTFSESVTGFTTGGITLNKTGTANGTVGLSGSGTTYTVTISSTTGDGTLGITVTANAAADSAGNQNTASSASTTFTVDNTAPTVSVGAPSTSLTKSGPVTYTVTFSESVTGFSTSGIQLNTTGTATGTVGLSGSGTTYTVTISSITGDGTLGITVKANSASDAAGNQNTASSASTTFTVDNTAPTVSIGAPSASVTKAGPVTYAVTFSESVTGFAANDVQLNTTGTATGTVGVTGSGTDYTVTLSSCSGDGTIGITVKAAGATDAAGNGNTVSSASATFTVDNTAPTVSVGAPSVSITKSGPVTYTVTFSESVTGLTTGGIQLNTTGTATGTVGLSGSGTTYTVTISSCSGDGTLGITVKANSAVDAAGNQNTASSASTTFTVDNTAPTVSVGAPSVSITKSGPVTYTVTFSESVTGFSTSGITLNKTGTANGSVGLSGSGMTYTVTISSITGDGTLGITVKANSASDAAGNQNTASSASTTFTVDNTAPTVSVGAPSVSLTKSGPVTYTVTFSESVTGFASGGITLNTTGSATGTVGVSGSGTTYTVTISSITGDGTLGITVKANSAVDAAGNRNTASSASTTFTVDNTAPTVSVGAPSTSLTKSGPVTYTVTFSESVTGFTTGGITLNKTGTANGTVGLSGSGTTYTVTISSITGDGTLGITVKANSASDAAGNQNTASSASTTFTVDNTAPTVSVGAPSVSLTKSGPVTYTVTFSESVTGLTTGGIQLNTTGTATGTVGLSGSGTTYTVTISSITGDGTLGITVKANSASDAAGNQNTASSASTTFTVDNTAPTASVGAPSVSLTKSGPVTYTVTFSESVTGFSSSGITLNTTGSATGTVGVSGSGTTYTVTISSITGDGTLGITVKANSASDAAGNQNTASSASTTFTVDNTAPTVSVGAPSTSLTKSGPVTYTVTFSESVTGFTTGGIQLNTTGTATGTVGLSGSGTTYTVTISSITGDGTLGITVKANSAVDAAGNQNTASSASTTFTVDNTAPTVSVGAPSVSITKSGPVTYTVTFSESVTGLTTGGIQLNKTGTADGTVGLSGSGTTYTVTISSITGDGTLGITVKANSASDAAGNQNTASSASTTFTVDNTAPTVGVGAPSVSLTKSGPVTYTVTFSESVTGFSTSGITLNKTGTANGTVGLSGSGTTYTVTISSTTGDGTLGITVKANSASDAAGNQNSASSASTTFTVDNTAPTVGIGAPSASITNSGPVTYTVTFSESVTGFTTGGITLNKTGTANGSVGLSGSGTTYTVTISSITGDGTLGITVNANAASDAAGNQNTASSASTTFTVDNTAPTVSVGAPSASLTTSGPVTYTVTFSESVTGLTTGGITLNKTGTANGSFGLSGSGTTYTVTISSITGDGTLGITVKANSAVDAAGNQNTASSASTTFTVDNTAPTVSVGAPSVSLTKSGPVTYTVTFSESVTGLTTGGIQLNKTGTADGSVGLSGSGTTYTVTISSITGDGTLGITVKANSAVDAAGNQNTASSASTTFTVDNTGPTVGVGAPSASITKSGPVTYTVTFSESVTGFSTSGVTLNKTGTANGSVGLSGSGTTYTVTISSITGDGTLGITVKANSAVDAAGNQNSASSDSTTFTVDNTAPTVSVGAPSAGATDTGPVTYTVTFSESVTGFTTSGIQLNKTGTADGSVGLSGSGTTYTVTISSTTGDGTLGITVKANSAVDAAGNQNTASSASTTFIVDNSNPTVDISSPSVSTTSTGPVTYTVTFSESVTGFAADDVTLNTTGDATGSVGVAGSGAGYTVTISSITGSGTIGISINAGAAVDVMSHQSQAGGPSATFTVNNTQPVVTIGSPSVGATISGPVTYDVTFSTSVTGFADDDITLNTTGDATGTVGVSGSGADYTVTISSISGNGTIGITVKAGAAVDGSSNPNLASDPSETFVVDDTKPSVSIGAPSVSTTNSGPVTYAVTFDEPVTGFTTGGITLNKTGSADGSIGLSGSGASYTVTISSITGNGTLGITVKADSASDAAGNLNTASSDSDTFTVDNTAPTVIVGAPSVSITNSGPVTYSVTFSESVTGFAANDVTLNATGNATGTVGVSGSGTDYTVTISDTSGDGTLGITVKANSATDASGNQNTASSASTTFTVDNTAPTASVGAPSASLTKSGPVTYTVTFSQSVTGLTTGGIQLNKTGTADGSVGLSGSGTTYTVTISSTTGDGTLGITVKANSAVDAAGNQNTASSASTTFTVDNTAPTVGVGAPSTSLTKAGPVTYTVTFSESVTGLTTAGIQLNKTGTADGSVGLSGSGTTYTVTISSITGDGTLGITVKANSAVDAAGNQNTASSASTTFTVDNTGPTVGIGAPSASLTKSGPVTYTVTFSDSVTGFSTSGITLNKTGTADGTVGLSGSGTTYTVTISSITGDGTLGITVKADSASDAAGNLNTASSDSDTFTVDNTAPTVIVGAPSVSITNSGPVTYSVTFSESVTGFAANDVILNATGTAAGSVGVSGSGANYTVTISDTSGDGALGITVNANSAVDGAGNQNTASAPSDTFTVDNTAPTVSIGAPSASLTKGGPVTYAVTFSKSVTGFATGGITLNKTGSADGSVGLSGSGTDYTVTISSTTGDGTLGITVNAGAAVDSAGNANTASSASTTFTVDNTGPTVSIGAPSVSTTNTGPVTYSVTFSESVTGLTTGGIQLNKTGSADGSVGLSGSGTTYTVTISSITGDGTLGITVKANSASDAAGNQNTASAPSTTFTVDNTAPTASTGAPSVSLTNTGPVTYAVTFSKPVTGFAVNGITLNATGTADGHVALSGSGTDYTVTISNTAGDGTLGITVKANSAVDASGNPNTASVPSTTFTVDNTDPTVSIGAPSQSLTNTGPVTYAVTFSKSVTGLTTAGIQLNKTGSADGTVGLSGSGTDYTVTISSTTGNGALGITVKADSAVDAAGNGNVASAPSTTFTVDNTQPTASVGAPSVSLTNTGPVTYTVTFSKSVTGFTTAGIQLNKTSTADGSVGLSGSGTTYTVTISSITGDGTLGITVKANSASDAAGNQNTASAPSTTFTVDNTAPTVSIGAPSVSLTNTGPVTYAVTFSKSVTGFAANGITLNATGTAEGIVGVSGSGADYTVTVSNTSGDGTLGITVKANSAVDAAGNENTASAPSTAFTVDNTAPTVSIGAPSVSTTNTGPVTYTVTFSKSVTGFTTGGITLNETGSADGSVGVSGSGADYTVTVSSTTGNGTLGITVNAGAAVDSAGNGNTASSPSTTFTVDNTAPTVSIGAPSVSTTSSGPVTYAVTFSKSVTGFAADDITLNTTGSATGSVDVSGSSTDYTVTISSITGNGTLGITVKANSATDASGNQNTASAPSATFIVDNVNPTVSIGAPSVGLTNTGPVTYAVTFNKSVTGFAADDITLNTTGTATGTAGVTGSGTSYTVTISNTSGDGTIGITVPANSAVDGSGNPNIASSPSDTFTVDNTAPTVSIGAPSASITKSGPVTYAVTFSKSVTGFAAGDVTLNATGTATGSVGVTGSGTDYTVTISSITGDGTLGITVNDAAAVDSAGNDSDPSLPSTTFTVDNTAPGVIVSAPSLSLTNTGPVTYTITFSQSVTGFTTAGIQLNKTGTANGSVGLSGSGTTYTATISSVTGDGTLGITVKANSAVDAAGNQNTASVPSATFTVDNTGPSVSIGAPSAALTTAGPITYTVTYSESVTGFAEDDLTLNATGTAVGTLAVSGSGTTYTVTVSAITGDGTLGITVKAAGATDDAGNPNSASAPSTTFTVDNTGPTVSIGDPSVSTTKAGPVTYTVTFNESVTGFAANDITLNTTGTATGTVGVSGSGTSYTVTISGTSGDGSLGITVNANSAVDAAGNQNSASAPSATFTVDNTGPTVSIGAPSASITNSGPVSYTVTFSESVTGFTTGGITLNATGTATGTVGVSGSGTTYTVTISGTSGNGTLGITVKANSAVDAAGNQNTASAPSATFIVDNTSPTVSIGAPSLTLTNSGPVTYAVTFSQPVTGFAADDITLNTTGTAAGTVTVSGSGADYTVTVINTSGDGTLGITVKANSAVDAAGNQNIASAPSATFTVDNNVPTVSVGAPSVAATNTGPVTYAVTFSESVTGFAADDITLNATGDATGTVGVSGSGASYTVTISSISGNGTLGITVNAGAAADSAGNLSTPSTPSATFSVDNAVPTVLIGAPSVTQTNVGPVTYSVTFSEPVTGFMPNDITLNPTGTATATIAVTGSGAAYTVTLSTISGNGTLGITVKANSVVDAAGNQNAASAPSTTFTVDNVLPTVSVGSPSVSATDSGPVTYSVTFSKSVTGFAANGVTLNATGTAAGTVGVSGSGTDYTVTISAITGNGALGITVKANSAVDSAGNQNTAGAPSTTFAVDNTIPSAIIGSPSLPVTNTGPVTYSVTFNEPVSGFTTGGITLNATGTAGGTAGVSGSGANYTVTISGTTGDGTLGITVNANAATDIVGHQSAASSPSTTFIVDNTRPIVTLGAPSVGATEGGPVTYSVTFSTAVTGFAQDDVVLNVTGTANGAIGVSGSGADYTITISAITGDGALGVSILPNAADDGSGNLSLAAGPSATFVVDNTPPSVVDGPPSPSTTLTGPVYYNVSFSEPVAGFAAAGVTLNTAGTATGTVGVSGSGAEYTVSVSGITGKGTIGVTVKADSAVDVAGNQNTAGNASTVCAVDATAPTVSVGAPSVSSTANGPVTYPVTFSEAVTGFAPAGVKLNTTGTATGTVAVSGSGADYTVTISGITGNGTLGITIKANAAVNVSTTPNLAGAPSTTFTVDNTAPTVSIGAPSVASTISGPVTYSVTFSKSVTGFTTGGITLDTTGTANGAVGVSGSGTDYAVTISSITGNGTLGITVNAGAAADTLGNANVASAPSGTFDVGSIPVMVAIGSPSVSATTHGPVTYPVTFSAPVTGFSAAGVTLNKTGTATGTVDVIGSGANYTVTVSGISGDGTLGITVNAGAATGAGGVASDAGPPSQTFAVDNTVPRIAFTFPTTGAPCSRNGSTIQVEGTVTDAGAISTVTWSLDSGPSGACIGTNVWTTSVIALTEGPNTITITATDSAGNNAHSSIMVTYVNTHPGDAWSGGVLLSLPIIPDSNDPKPMMGFSGNYWYIYGTLENRWIDYTDHASWFEPPEATPGRGFCAKFPSGVTPNPVGIVPPQDRPAAIDLEPGWNLIGEPFISSVTWSLLDIQVQAPNSNPISLAEAGGLVRSFAWGYNSVTKEYYLIYDSSIVPGIEDQLRPWMAYWIYAYQECSLILPPPGN